MVIFGKAERDNFENIRATLSDAVCKQYDDAIRNVFPTRRLPYTATSSARPLLYNLFKSFISRALPIIASSFFIKSAANIDFSAFTADLIYLDIIEKNNSAVKGSFHDFTAGLIIYSTSFPLILPNQQIRQINRQIQ